MASQRNSGIDGFLDFWIFSGFNRRNALGIGAASFWSAAEKDIAESPTAIAGTPKRKTTSQQNHKTIRKLEVES